MDEHRQRQLTSALGQVLANARVSRGMTQEDVASALGIGNEAVSRMERGIVMPTLVRLFEFADLFDCPVEGLLTQTSDREQDQAQELLKKLQALKPKDRALAVRILGELCEHMGAPKQGG